MPDPLEDKFGPASEAVRRTPWTLISRAQKGDAGAREKALERIYTLYNGPVRSFLRGRGLAPEEAGELTQEFFTRLLERNFVDRLDPARGRLRHFLFASLRRFICDEADRRFARKRGGDQKVVSLDRLKDEFDLSEEDSKAESPQAQFSRLWVGEILDRVLERMRRECAGTSRETWYRAVCLWHRVGPDGAASYSVLGDRLGVNAQQAANYLFRGRTLLRSLVLEELRATCATAQDVRDEVKELFKAWE